MKYMEKDHKRFLDRQHKKVDGKNPLRLVPWLVEKFDASPKDARRILAEWKITLLTCQVSGCDGRTTKKCSAGFRYCGEHSKKKHGAEGERHAWKKVT